MFLLELLVIFALILAGNQMGYCGRWGWPLGNTPVSTKYLGSHKTWGAYYTGPLFGASAALVEYTIPPARAFLEFGNPLSAMLIGAFVGLCVVLGDHINSLAKRRLGLPPGSPSPSDRIDWMLAGGIGAWIVIPNMTLLHVAVLVIVGVPIHVLGNKSSYKRGWRNTPH